MEKYIDILTALLTFIAVAVPGILKALKKIERTWIQTLFLSIVAGLMVFGLIKVFDMIFKPSPPQITILQPSGGSAMDCTSITQDGYCIYPVTGKVSAILEPNHKIYVIIKERGGNEWWVSGGAVQQQDIVNNTWEQPWASFGKRDSPVKSYLVCALITTEQYGPTQKFQSIPSNVIASTTISVTRN